jgi:hypothetical protein
MTENEANDINVGMDLYHQLVEAKMEAERWKAKYEDLEQRLAGDEVTRLMAEVIDWREKYDQLDKAHDRLEAQNRHAHMKESLVHNSISMYDTVIDLIQHPMIEAKWEELLFVFKLVDADRYAAVKKQIEGIMRSRSMNAPE